MPQSLSTIAFVGFQDFCLVDLLFSPFSLSPTNWLRFLLTLHPYNIQLSLRGSPLSCKQFFLILFHAESREAVNLLLGWPSTSQGGSRLPGVFGFLSCGLEKRLCSISMALNVFPPHFPQNTKSNRLLILGAQQAPGVWRGPAEERCLRWSQASCVPQLAQSCLLATFPFSLSRNSMFCEHCHC